MLRGALIRRGVPAIVLCVWLGPILTQNLLAQDGQDVEALAGILSPRRPAVPVAQARQKCIDLPALPADRTFLGPHGDSLISTRCEVISFGAIEKAQQGWFAAHYRWTFEFTAEDPTRGPSARDTVEEEEVVLLDSPRAGQVRPIWRERFETGPYAVWASLTPEVTPSGPSATLFSVMRCVNGTGGCGQDFLLRRQDGRWVSVRQDWLKQLPAGYLGRIRHGTHIDPLALRGESGFYGDADPNCCPAKVLTVNLALRGNSLVLVSHTVATLPPQ